MSNDSEVGIKITAETGQATQGITQVGDKLKDLNPIARELFESFGELRKTFIEAFAIREISEFIEHFAELGEQAVRTSQMLGMSVEEVQKLGFAARMVGGNNEGMVASLLRVERSMAEAQDGTSRAAKAYEALGISQEQLRKSSPEQMMFLVADAFKNAKDGADKVAIAYDIGGRSMSQQIPLLNKGAEGLRELGMEAVNTGSVMTQWQAEGLEKTAQGLTTLKANVEGAGLKLMEVFKPAIDTVIDGLTSLVQVFRVVIELINVAVLAIDNNLLRGLAAVIEGCEEMGVRIGSLFNTIKMKAEEVGAVLTLLAHGELQEAVNEQNSFEKRIADSSATAQKEVQKLRNDYADLTKQIDKATEAAIKNTIGMGKTAGEGGEKKQLHAPSGGTATEDKTEEQIEKNDLATFLEINRLRIAGKKEADQEMVASGRMTKLQELADLKDFTSQEYLLNMDAMQAQANLYEKDSAEYHALMNKKKVITEQYNNEMKKLNLQTINAEQQQYTKFFSSLNQAFGQMVNGILQGTQTWQQAMGHLFSNILSKFIQDLVIEPVLQWGEGKLKMLGITQIFGQENAAAEAVGAAESKAVNVAANVAKITADGALTFAGVFANLSPIMGPAAAGPAAASEALVMAMIPQASLAVGAWDLDSDMVAQLHKGEMVVPENFASGIRSNASGGGASGDQYNITIQAIDTQTGAAFLKNNAHVIASAISGRVRNFDKNLPAWKGN